MKSIVCVSMRLFISNGHHSCKTHDNDSDRRIIDRCRDVFLVDDVFLGGSDIQAADTTRLGAESSVTGTCDEVLVRRKQRAKIRKYD